MIQLPEAEYERMCAIVAAAQAWADDLTSIDREIYLDDAAIARHPIMRTRAELYRAVMNGTGSRRASLEKVG